MSCVEQIQVAAYTIPTDEPESDGTLCWDSTTLIVVQVSARGTSGLGYTYSDQSVAPLISRKLAPLIIGREVMDVEAAWARMVHAVRNLGRPGLASTAISAVDAALWDLKARELDLPLVTLLGSAREAIDVYGSGGFTSYTDQRLQEQFAGWAQLGIRRMKMKVGREPERDIERVAAARQAVGPDVELFVDANGAHSRKMALKQAERFAELGVTWFEEPVSSDDLAGLRLLRDRGPAGMDIAAGEYGYDLPCFLRMLNAQAVDVLQADATRCGGITGFLRIAALCDAFGLPLSAHTAPALHIHVCCAAPRVCHVEYFHDHARIESLLWEGVQPPAQGQLTPDLSRPGMGLEFKFQDAERFATTDVSVQS